MTAIEPGRPLDAEARQQLAIAKYRVVLNRRTAYGATNADVFGWGAALVVARDYWEQAENGHAVQIFCPPDSRDMADWQWIKGIDAGIGPAS